MIGELSGKVAFITGAASGIGLGMAHAFAEAGMKVAMADIEADTLAQAAADLSATGATVLPLPLDVSDRAGWATAAEHVQTALGPVQLLCNNAGVSALGMDIAEMDPGFWDKVVAINLTGVFNGVRTFAGGMRAAGGGHIVNTASLAGLSMRGKGATAYAATKFAVVGLSEAMRGDMAPEVGVSVVCPGAVRSRLWRTSRRIRGLPDTDVPPPESMVGSASPTGLDPMYLGRRIVEAVRADEFYVITHAGFRPALVQRHEELMTAFDRAEAAFDPANQEGM